MTVSQQAKEHAERLRQVHRARLEELEIQIAKFGPSAPPHLTIEYEEIKQKLATIEPLANPIVDPQISALLRRYDQLDMLSSFLTDHSRRLRAVEERLEGIVSDIRQWFEKRDTQVIEDHRIRGVRQHKLDIGIGVLFTLAVLNTAAIAVLIIWVLING